MTSWIVSNLIILKMDAMQKIIEMFSSLVYHADRYFGQANLNKVRSKRHVHEINISILSSKSALAENLARAGAGLSVGALNFLDFLFTFLSRKK